MTAFIHTDIDIDIANRDDAIRGLQCVRAVEIKNGEVKQHGSGVYFQDIPADPITGLSVFDYDEAKTLGYFKVDLLSSHQYEGVENEAHLDRLLAHPVDWSSFEHRAIVDDLQHIHGHFGVVQSIKPKSIEDLAVILALIRGGKSHLVGRPREEIDAQIWTAVEGRYYFKRAHAIAYAHAIIVQLNRQCEAMEQMLSDMENDADCRESLFGI